MERRILIVTTEVPPCPGRPVTGGGLRVHGLAEGLRSVGHRVIYALPRALVEAVGGFPEGWEVVGFEEEGLSGLIAELAPDVVLFEQWGLATYLEERPSCLVVLDFHGSLVCENYLRSPEHLASDMLTKILTLEKVDYFVCPGERQRYYFLPWLMMSGCSPEEERICVVPVSLSPELPEHRYPEEITFVYGGVPWPWVDSASCLGALRGALAAAGRGELHVFAGAHADLYSHRKETELGRDQAKARLSELGVRPGDAHVTIHGLAPHEELLARYAEASVAFDLYKRNRERELAFTTRTIEYL